MTREDAIKIWLPIISMGVDNMPELKEAFDMAIKALEQEPRCKECKWWKDSDGVYRRDRGAESKCPINRKEVFEGNGYCYLFESLESEDK